jgi:NAD(P)-dependent dehydrogenase (short-subunit alcohol dehydrogenase family)
LVTGGDSGIGLAAVEAFYDECAQVMLIGHNASKTEAAAANVTARPTPACPSGSPPPAVRWAALDIRNRTAVAAAIDSTVSSFGSLDIAVNDAGSAAAELPVGDPQFLDAWQHDSAMSINVDGTLTVMNLVLQRWVALNISGKMINVASICGERPLCTTGYTTSKFAMIGFSEQAAITYAPRGIRINILAPGAVNTAMLRGGLARDDPVWLQRKAQMEKTLPSGRIGEPYEAAAPITFLATPEANFFVGATVTMDGGYTLAGPGYTSS